MTQRINHRQWLYLLTALVLLMQSFAIWHDASHPYHLADAQCQQFESISHTPTLDLASAILPQLTVQFSAASPSITFSYASKRLHADHAIRAPPIFS